MNICITGGAGMIGSSMLKRFTDAGHQVCVIDNLWRGKIDNIKGIAGYNLENKFFNIDLSDMNNYDKITDIFKEVQVVVHLADIVAGIGYVFNNQYDIFRINNQINSIVFNACEKAKVKKLLYSGTVCSFPLELQNSLTSILKEEQLFPAHPESAYGWSKLLGILELEYLKEKTNMDISTLMLHNVYGPNCDIDPLKSQVIPSLINKIIDLEDNEKLDVWGSGEQGRAFIYVEDVVDAFATAIEKDDLPSIIQIGPDKCTSIKELVLVLKDKIIKKEFEIFFDSSKPEGDKGRAADYTIASKTLGWNPKTDIEKGLLSTYNWIKREKEKNV